MLIYNILPSNCKIDSRMAKRIYLCRRIKDKFSLIKALDHLYFLLNKFIEIKMKSYSTDFRLIDKEVINHLKEFRENISFMRGIMILLALKLNT